MPHDCLLHNGVCQFLLLISEEYYSVCSEDNLKRTNNCLIFNGINKSMYSAGIVKVNIPLTLKYAYFVADCIIFSLRLERVE